MAKRFSKMIDRVQFLGILFGIVAVPLVFNVQNQNIVILKPLIAQSLAYLLFGLWLVDSVERGEFRLIPSALNVPIVLYFLWLILSITFNPDFLYFNLEELNRYLSVFLMFFLVQKTIRNPIRLKWSLWVLVGVSLVATAYGLLQYNGIQLIEWGRSVLVSTFGNKNFFAGFLVLTTPFVAGYAIATSKLPVRIVLGILAVTQFSAILFTQTRTGFLGVAIGLVIFFCLGMRFVWWPRTDNWTRDLTIGLVLLGTFLVILYLVIPEVIIKRIFRAADLHIGTGRVRWIMWTGASRAALDRPLVGHGHGSFQLVFPNYRPTFYHRFRVSHNTRHSHNEYFEILLETGLVGLSLFLLIFVVLGLVTYRFLNRNKSWFYQWLVIGIISSIGGSLAQNFASVNLRWMSTTFVFWFLVAALIATIRIASDADHRFTDLLSEKNSRSITASQQLFPEFSWKTGFHVLVGVVLAGAGYGFYCMIMGDFLLKTTNSMIRASESKRLSWERTAQTGEQSVSYNPYNLSARYKLGFIYLKMPDYRRAFDAYDTLTDLAPNYAQIHNNIALIHRNFDRPYRSLLHFEWATTLEDNFRNHMNLARRHRRHNLSKRAVSHGLSISRIYHEQQRDFSHKISVDSRKHNWISVQEKKEKYRENLNPKLVSGLSIVSEGIHQFYPPLSDFTDMKSILLNPGDQNVLKRIIGRHQREGTFPSPVSLLAMSSQLRAFDSENINSIKTQYVKVLVEWLRNNPESDPLYRLVLADLSHQIGDRKNARKSISDLKGRWKDNPYLREIVNRITKKQ